MKPEKLLERLDETVLNPGTGERLEILARAWMIGFIAALIGIALAGVWKCW